MQPNCRCTWVQGKHGTGFDRMPSELPAALESGTALAFLGTENIVYGIDRVVAITDTGRGYVWHQINACGERVFDGDPPPPGCPPPPSAMAPDTARTE